MEFEKLVALDYERYWNRCQKLSLPIEMSLNQFREAHRSRIIRRVEQK